MNPMGRDTTVNIISDKKTRSIADTGRRELPVKLTTRRIYFLVGDASTSADVCGPEIYYYYYYVLSAYYENDTITSIHNPVPILML